jgi:hypothetical protein
MHLALLFGWPSRKLPTRPADERRGTRAEKCDGFRWFQTPKTPAKRWFRYTVFKADETMRPKPPKPSRNHYETAPKPPETMKFGSPKPPKPFPLGNGVGFRARFHCQATSKPPGQPTRDQCLHHFLPRRMLAAVAVPGPILPLRPPLVAPVIQRQTFLFFVTGASTPKPRLEG